MTLEVIGAGFGRTGTLSLKAAFEQLGFAPCYHQYELIAQPEHASSWSDAYSGNTEALRVPLRDYKGTVDWPSCTFWRELADLFPDAKVVLSLRPPQRWYASFRETVGALLSLERQPGEIPGVFVPVVEMNKRVIRDHCFGPDFDVNDEERIIAAYERHNAAVRAGVEPRRLLEFDIVDGWGTLCHFLEVPVPNVEFPNVNDREDFRKLFGLGEYQREPQGHLDREVLEQRFRDAMAPNKKE